MEELIQESLERAISDQKLEEIDIDYYYEGIDSQIETLLSIPSKKNYIKKFEKKVNDEELGLLEEEKEYLLDDMYSRVIDMISEKLGFTVNLDDVKLSSLAKTLYNFFVLEYTENLTNFLEMYIIENKETLIKNLVNPIEKRIEGLPNKISIILNNLSDIIELIFNDDLEFSDYIKYINMHPNSKSSADIIMEYDKNCLNDTDKTIENIIQGLIDEDDGYSKIYTDLQLRIFNRFVSKSF